MNSPPPPATFFVCLLAVEALHLLLPGPRLLEAPWTLLGLPVILSGVWLHWAAFRLFRLRGASLATLEVPRLLVMEGPFLYSRNPMYTAGIMILLGLALFLGSTSPFLVPVLFGNLSFRWYIRPEEELLARELGEVYGAYRARVRRWL